jgi:uncharacterized membrane protein YadS
LLLSSAVAIGAVTAARLLGAFAPIPAMVIALIIGIALNPLAQRRSFQAGIVFCLKSILRWAVALLGLRIALGEIAALGVTTAILVVVAMVLTLATGFLLARLFALERGYGALAGAGTAVCGASATLATSIVLPDYKGKEMDVAFVVVAVNALSTLAMVVYPLLCVWLGFDAQTAGIMLGATIHDVAQVPLVLAIGWLFARRAVATSAAKIPIPLFAIVFVALCVLNSIAAPFPAAARMLAWIKLPLIEASTWGLLIAISALGLGTSLTAMAALGWRHVATVTGTTLIILAAVTVGLTILR